MKYSAVRRRLLSLPFALFLFCVLLFACTLHTYADTSTLEVEGANAIIYGDDLALTVRSDAALAGKTVTLTPAGEAAPIGTAVLDSEGVATLTVVHPANAAEGRIAYRLEAGAQTLTVDCEGQAATLTLTVSPRPVTLEDFAVADRIYDGTTAATATHGGLAGVLAGDTVSLLEGSCHFQRQLVAYDAAGAVTAQPVTVSGYALGSTHYYNYELALPANVTATILPKEVHVLGLEALSRPYDGTTAVTLQGGTLDPADIVDDDLTILGLAVITGKLTDPSAGLQPVALNEIFLTGAAAGNYRVVVPEVTAEIQKAKLTLSVEKVTINKGQSIPALTARAEGFVGGDGTDLPEGFALPAVVPAAVNTLNVAQTSFTVSFEGGNATHNYEFDRDTYAAVALKINTVTVDASAYVISVEDLTVWHNAVITVTPTGDWVGITTDAADSTASLDALRFWTVLSLDAEGENTVSFALRHVDGTVTEPVTLSYKLDTVAPTGNVLWREQSLLTDGEPVYRYFSKSALVLSFIADDGSGSAGIAKLEYALGADGPFTEIIDGSATVATEAGLYTVYYRLTDGAGNVTLYRTDGMVLYADATVVAPTLSFERLSGLDATVSLTLNGNTLAALTDGNHVALTDAQFALNDDGLLTVKAEYLSALAAGEYTLTVTLAPLGQPFVELAVNDRPVALTLSLTVTRRAPVASDLVLTLPENTVYDGGEKTATVTAPAGMGAFVIYYETADGQRLNVIKNAGTYAVKVDISVGYDYGAAEGLTLGELTVAKKKPAAPQVAFHAVDGSLSGETAGLVYSLNGTDYAPLPERFSGVVTNACTLYFYLPGDGLNTVDSEVAILVVTRAAVPAVVPVDESLFAACDGKLYAVTEGLEYRHVGEESWRPVEGTRVLGLAPGTYQVRVAAAGSVLESAAVQVVILAAPEFLTLEREASAAEQPTVTLKGELTARAELSLLGLTADVASTSPIRSLSIIDRRTTEVVGFFEPVLNGRHSGALTLVIAVGEVYNGKTLTVHRETADGNVETLSLLCEDGVLTLTVDALSPVLVTTPMTTPHGIGSTAWIWVLAVLLALTVAVCVAIEIVIRKRKNREK